MDNTPTVESALIIKPEWLDRILSGQKTWELRGRQVHRRGPIALIPSGSRHVVGVATLRAVHGPLTIADLLRTTRKHRVPKARIRDGLPWKNVYAWELRDVKPLPKPVRYRPKPGAVIWVTLTPAVARKVNEQAG